MAWVPAVSRCWCKTQTQCWLWVLRQVLGSRKEKHCFDSDRRGLKNVWPVTKARESQRLKQSKRMAFILFRLLSQKYAHADETISEGQRVTFYASAKMILMYLWPAETVGVHSLAFIYTQMQIPLNNLIKCQVSTWFIGLGGTECTKDHTKKQPDILLCVRSSRSSCFQLSEVQICRNYAW